MKLEEATALLKAKGYTVENRAHAATGCLSRRPWRLIDNRTGKHACFISHVGLIRSAKERGLLS